MREIADGHLGDEQVADLVGIGRGAAEADGVPGIQQLRHQLFGKAGTIKHQILGNARLLMRGLTGAKAELSLAVLAYNLKRAMNMKGASWMLNALRA